MSFRRGAIIVRRLCVLLDAERVYRELSTILEGEDNLDFASTMVQVFILSEVSSVKGCLKHLDDWFSLHVLEVFFRSCYFSL